MNDLKVAFLIIGAIIGAGFASGKEIFVYFAKFGGISIIFLIPLFVLLYIFTKTFLQVGKKNKEISITSLNKSLCSNVHIFNKPTSIFNIFMLLTFLILSSAMFSGLISLFNTYFSNTPLVFLYIIVTVFTIVLLNFSFKTLTTISAIVVPLIVGGIIMLSLFSNIHFSSFTFISQSPHMLPILTIFYASQNMFLASFAIIDAGKKQPNITKVSLLVSSIICILIFVGILCFLNNPDLGKFPMPFAEISKSINPLFSIIFGVIIFFSIITTYIASISSLKEFFKGDKKYNKQSVMLLLIVLLSLLNFGTIIEFLYPIIGLFGVVYFLFARAKFA